MANLKRLQRRAVIVALILGNIVMTLVVLQQRRTIAYQGELIHQLLQDSLELAALRLEQHAKRGR